ncbi:BppU family phage baseplate upper protein [Bacillus cereus]|nr:BppU family phage baseplate upper protein [Bacillus cereus]
MTLKTYEFTTDLIIDIEPTQNIRFFQNDHNSAHLIFFITDRKQPVNLSNAKVKIVLQKPDGTIVFQDNCTPIDAATGKYEVILNTQTLVIDGKGYGQVHIEDGDKILECRKFEFFIDKSILSQDVLESTNEFLALQKAIQAGVKLEGIDIDEIVAAGNVVQEVVRARVDENGQTSSTLKERIDKGFLDNAKYFTETSAVLKSKYKLKCDGTDSIATLQNALNDLKTLGYKEIQFPPSSSFNFNQQLVIPDDLTIDFNRSTITTPNAINITPIKLSGSNTKLKKLKLIQKDHNHSAPAGVNGIEFKGNKNVDNIFLFDVEVEGFEMGINIHPQSGFVASNVKFFNCRTNDAELHGLNVSNVYDVTVENHEALRNALDGFKTIENATRVRVIGGNFSFNKNPSVTYADGIDLYAGARDVVISSAVCDFNGGCGIHILSGELNDINYQNPVLGIIKDLVLNNCICKNNESAGIDVLCKTSVSPTTPYASKILLNSCICTDNGIGINITARNVILNSCLIHSNKKHGVQVVKGSFVTMNDLQIIKNSLEAAGSYSGIYLSGCRYVKINGGIINGSDDDTLKNEDGSNLTKYHQYGIHIYDTDNSEFIEINNPTIINYTSTRSVYIDRFSVPENNSKSIIVKVGDVGTNPVNNQIGSAGSEFLKSGRKYIKKTGLNSVMWEMQLHTNYGNANFYANGTLQSFVIPHNLGTMPLKYNVIPNRTINNYAVTADETNLIVTFSQSLPGGTYPFTWEASA